jgi:hypothetical protein
MYQMINSLSVASVTIRRSVMILKMTVELLCCVSRQAMDGC